jgi:DNA mismatch repair ATPase MutS
LKEWDGHEPKDITRINFSLGRYATKGGITLKLYEISQNYSQLLDMADVLDEQTFQDTLQAIEEVLEDKVENIGKFVRCLDADIEAIKSEEKRLADKRKA